MVEDVKCAIRHLRMRARAYNIDPNRIGAIGLSSGAYLAAMLGVTDASAGFEGHGAFEGVSSRVQAVVAEYAHYDYLRPSYSGAEREEREAALPPDASQDFLRAVSVYTYVSADDPPFAIYHGDADPALDPAQSEEMNRRLQAAGVTSSFTLVKNGGHGWLANSPRKAGVTDALTPTGTAIVAQELDFFDRYLKP
jgi:acetyl esterase/lipase